jgi:hypothetical protein
MIAGDQPDGDPVAAQDTVLSKLNEVNSNIVINRYGRMQTWLSRLFR